MFLFLCLSFFFSKETSPQELMLITGEALIEVVNMMQGQGLSATFK